MSETSKTKTEIFAERLNKFATEDEAKTHLKEIAKELGCSPALGYKALKISKFATAAPSIPTPEVPTVKIPEVELPPIPEAETPSLKPLFEGEKEIGETEAEITAPPQPPTPTAAPTPEIAATPLMLKLQPILERSIGRIFNTSVEIASGVKETLSSQEAEDTATLLPILIYRITKVSLTEDQFIDMTCATHFGSIVLKVFKEWRQRREQAPHPQPQPTPQPQPEPAKPPQAEAQIEATTERPKTAPIMNRIQQQL